jgi:DNA-directed RNA polymerase-3 subunit RPC5
VLHRRRLYIIDSKYVGKLYLHPVHDVQQLRPNLTYLDAMSKKQKRVRGDDSDNEGPPPDPDEPAPPPTIPKASP